MIISNEPGYYKFNEYGIRIENLVLIKEKQNNRLFFENLSWCPIDRELINKDLLNKKEVEWINTYHANVFIKLNVFMNDNEKKWLKLATEQI